MKSRSKAGANKCCQSARMQRTRKVCRSQCMGFSVLLLSQTRTRTKFIVPEVHFHAESIGPSPVVITRKMAKLFKFLHSQTQGDPTIHVVVGIGWTIYIIVRLQHAFSYLCVLYMYCTSIFRVRNPTLKFLGYRARYRNL